MGMKKETETFSETRLRPRSAQEQNVLNLLEQMAAGAAGGIDLQSLAGLASGQGLAPTAGDQQLVQESIGAAGDAAQRSLEDFIREANLGLDETLSSRGVQGSSIESVQRSIVDRDAVRQLMSMLDRERAQKSQALLQVPFQRAGVQLNANQALFNQLLQGGGALSQFGLQERVADIDQFGTQSVSPSALEYMQAAANMGEQAANLGK